MKERKRETCARSHTRRVGQRLWDKDSVTETVRDIGAESVRCRGSGTDKKMQTSRLREGGPAPRPFPGPRGSLIRPCLLAFLVLLFFVIFV